MDIDRVGHTFDQRIPSCSPVILTVEPYQKALLFKGFRSQEASELC